MFTNVNEDLAATKKGDYLSYGLHGTTASMVIHDEHEGDDDSGGMIEFSVEWDTVAGSGSMHYHSVSGTTGDATPTMDADGTGTPYVQLLVCRKD